MTAGEDWIGPLCRDEDVAEGRSLGLDPLREGRDTMFLVRRDGSLFGYRNACPHYDYAPMAWRRHEFLNGDHTMIRCAAHGALFRIEDGVCELGPCIGETLTKVRISVAEGEVFVAAPYAPGRRKSATPRS